MTDPVHVDNQLGRLARVRDEQLRGLDSGPAARTLLASLVAEGIHADDPAPSRRREWPRLRRLGLATAAVSAMTVLLMVGLSLLEVGSGNATSYANSAIEVTREGDFFVARIKDPLADHAMYVEAFQAVGKDVDIELVPVPLDRVGQLLEASGGGSFSRVSTELVSSGASPVDCALKPASCTMVVRISADTTGRVRYRLGRAARPGEAYQTPAVGAPDAPASSGPRGGSGN